MFSKLIFQGKEAYISCVTHMQEITNVASKRQNESFGEECDIFFGMGVDCSPLFPTTWWITFSHLRVLKEKKEHLTNADATKAEIKQLDILQIK